MSSTVIRNLTFRNASGKSYSAKILVQTRDGIRLVKGFVNLGKSEWQSGPINGSEQQMISDIEIVIRMYEQGSI